MSIASTSILQLDLIINANNTINALASLKTWYNSARAADRMAVTFQRLSALDHKQSLGLPNLHVARTRDWDHQGQVHREPRVYTVGRLLSPLTCELERGHSSNWGPHPRRSCDVSSLKRSDRFGM